MDALIQLNAKEATSEEKKKAIAVIFINLSQFQEGVGDCEVIEVSSGEEAIDIAREKKPHLIFMDIMMPCEIDGLVAAKTLKDASETKDITIIMLTARGQKQDIEKGQEAGADDYFIKPFSPTAFIQKVEQVLETGLIESSKFITLS